MIRRFALPAVTLLLGVWALLAWLGWSPLAPEVFARWAPAAVLAAWLVGVTVGRFGGPAPGAGRTLLQPSELPRRLRRWIVEAYDGERSFESVLTELEAELRRHPESLSLQFWRIRTLLELARRGEARAELVALLPRLPEAALTVRWGVLFEQVGEREIWIRHVLERIRSGTVVRRSTFRELVRLLEDEQRFAEGIEVLERVRAVDPPTPEEEAELQQTEMILRARWARQLLEEGDPAGALREARKVREVYPAWRAPYRLAAEALFELGDADKALSWLLDGFRNSGDPDLLLAAYERQQRELDVVTILGHWDDRLGDRLGDGWYLLTTGWIAFRHTLLEEGVKRLRRIPPDDEAYGHARCLEGLIAGERGHAQAAAAAAAEAGWAWRALPYLWRCGRCGALARHAAEVCPACGAWEAYQMVRPVAREEAARRGLVALSGPN